MAITLDGTGGITTPAESVSGALSVSGTTTLGSGILNIGSGQIYKDASGNLGIGTSSPGAKLEASISSASVVGKFSHTGSVLSGALLVGDPSNVANSTSIYLRSTGANSINYASGGYLAFSSSGDGLTERMRLDSSGNLLVGKTASSQTSGEGVQLSPTTAAVNSYMAIVSPNSLTGTNIISAYSTGASNFRFYIQWDGKIYATSTSITAISDISLKENIRPLETGLAEVLALQPRRFDWKNGDGSNIAGFIAQEVESVLPDLVSDYKYNEEETKRGLKMGDMIPTLVKAIQELTARLEALENK